MKPKYPKTVAEAVDRLLNHEMTEENIEKIRRMQKDNLIEFHFGLGGWIRNSFGFWDGNQELVADCAKQPGVTLAMKLPDGSYFMDPDDASGVILEKLWDTLHENTHLRDHT